MKKLIPLLFLITLCTSILQAQTWRRIGGWGNELTGVSWVNEEVGFISGNEIILKSIDGGLSWSEQAPPTKAKMHAVDFFSENLGVMVGENGLVFRTANGGANWTAIELGAEIQLNKVKFLNQNRVYAVGDKGEVYRSTDSGQSWARQQVGSTADLKDLYFVNADTGYVSTSAGTILRTFNGGNNWNTQNTGVNSILFGVHFSDGKVGYAVGAGGIILKTEDAGLSWTRINSGTERDLYAVTFNKSNPALGVVTGEEATLMRTVNAGLTFDGININNSENYVAASFRTISNVVFAVGSNGFAIASNNSGQSWALRISGRNIDFTATTFKTATLGYMIGPMGGFFFTNNGGNTLGDRSRPLSVTFNDLYFTTNAFGYIAGEKGTILRTTNSGANWTSLNPRTEDNINGLYFSNNNIGYAVGDRGYISKTEDGGINWQSQSVGTTNVDLMHINFFDAETGIVIGSNGFVAVSDAEQWNIRTIGTSEVLTKIGILDESTAIIIGAKATIFKTIDKGNTWKKINTSFTEDMRDLEFLDESIGFMAGTNGHISQTRNGGESWQRLNTSTFQDFSGLSFGTLSHGFAVGENGTIFNYSCQVPETPTVIFGEKNICLSRQEYSVQASEDPEDKFEWRIDGGTIVSGQGSNKIIVEWDSAGRHAVLVRGQNFCGNGGTRALEVTVSTTSQAITEIQGEGVVCLETFVRYQVQPIPGTTFIWQVAGGVLTEGQGTNEILVRWLSTGNNSVNVTPENPCGEGTAFKKDILVTTPPQQTSVISGPEMAGFTEEEYSVTQLPDINYQWTVSNEGGTILSGQGTSKIRVRWAKEGEFEISVVAVNGCNAGPTRSLKVNINVITSIAEEKQNEALIQVYPNPSTGDFQLKLDGIGAVRSIRLINAMGQTIRTLQPSIGVHHFEFQQIPRGLYTIAIQTREKEFFRKIVVK